ncbi:hypothetical protein ACH436_20440 [Isoptericola sp. NPDC019693]|uniref:hypothetical protein n=1 Tax=Isoptericola sp. NPDC019693 TaxID=3364009 RepID=UPI0037B7D1E9
MHDEGESAQSSTTLFCALYGLLRLYPDAADGDVDPEGLFLLRSESMGWLEDRALATNADGSSRAVGSPGLWHVLEAGYGDESIEGDSPTIWFHAALSNHGPEGVLPTQPFVRCALDVTGRLGFLDHLHAVQMIVPVGHVAASEAIPHLNTADWFSTTSQESRVRVSITIQCGADFDLSASAPQIFDAIRSLDQSVLQVESLTARNSIPTAPPPLIDELWHGPVRHEVQAVGTIANWAAEEIGWAAGFIAELCRSLGSAVPIAVSFSREVP